MSVVGVDLDQRLDELQRGVRDSLSINAFHHLKEVVTVDHTLIDLLILFLQLSQHFEHFLFDKRFELG